MYVWYHPWLSAVVTVLVCWLLQGVNFSPAFYYNLLNPSRLDRGSRSSETSNDKSTCSHPSASEVCLCLFYLIYVIELSCVPLVGQHEGHLAFKKLSGGILAWLCVCSEMQICICPADATATHCLLLHKIQIGFTFLVLPF